MATIVTGALVTGAGSHPEFYLPLGQRVLGLPQYFKDGFSRKTETGSPTILTQWLPQNLPVIQTEAAPNEVGDLLRRRVKSR